MARTKSPPKKLSTHLYVTEHVWRIFRSTCALQGVSASITIETLITTWLKEQNNALTQVYPGDAV